MDSMLGLLERFLASFSPSYIYEGAYQIATSYLSVLSGVLLLIAVMIRLGNSSLDSLEGQGRYAALLKSLLIWRSVLALYFVLAGLVTELFNVLYNWTRSNGSIGRALSELGVVLNELNLRQTEARETMGTLDMLGDLAANIPRGIAFFLFFISFVLLVSIQLFFQIAQAIGYTVALVFGTVAIPMAVSQKLSILRGWGVFTATILSWPIVESLFMYLILGMSAQLGNDLTDVSATNASAAGIYLIFTVMNIVMTVTIISAPFVTMAIISNSGNFAGLVTPFVGGAMATTAAVTRTLYEKSVAQPARLSAAGVGGATSAAGTAAVSKMRSLFGGHPGPSPVCETPATPSAGTNTSDTSQSGPGVVTERAQDSTAHREPKPRRSAADQAKRGAIINHHTKPKP